MPELLAIIEKGKREPHNSTSDLGRRGEMLAARYVSESGYRIVVSNFKVPVGRNRNDAKVTGEIDIVALDGETLAFIEVKTRSSEEFLPIITAVDRRKQRQITRTARAYLRAFNIRGVQYRFDVVTVLIEKRKDPVIELRKGFWSEANFRKRSWNDNAWNEFA